MTDKEIVDFIQSRGLQIWPVRKTRYGPVTHWYVQNVLPFIQSYGQTLQEAMTKLKKALDEQ